MKMVSTIRQPLMIGCRLRMKGTMSEAELHILRARLRGGILNQAQRAALKLQLPVGLVYVEEKTVHLDPDAQVQNAFRVLFATDHSDSVCLGHGEIRVADQH